MCIYLRRAARRRESHLSAHASSISRSRLCGARCLCARRVFCWERQRGDGGWKRVYIYLLWRATLFFYDPTRNICAGTLGIYLLGVFLGVKVRWYIRWDFRLYPRFGSCIIRVIHRKNRIVIIYIHLKNTSDPHKLYIYLLRSLHKSVIHKTSYIYSQL